MHLLADIDAPYGGLGWPDPPPTPPVRVKGWNCTRCGPLPGFGYTLGARHVHVEDCGGRLTWVEPDPPTRPEPDPGVRYNPPHPLFVRLRERVRQAFATPADGGW
jgi:hypothetical protein